VSNDVPTYGHRQGDVLCLSGGGFRAALFHLGALTRLNELGLLAETETIVAVAGGSILAALLAARVPWPLQGASR
jgi:NTE family protein